MWQQALVLTDLPFRDEQRHFRKLRDTKVRGLEWRGPQQRLRLSLRTGRCGFKEGLKVLPDRQLWDEQQQRTQTGETSVSEFTSEGAEALMGHEE